MFIGIVTFVVYQVQKAAGRPKNTNTQVVNKNKNKNKNTNTNVNTNPAPAIDLGPLAAIPDTWKYYTNPVVTYTIRYPSDWILQEVNIPEHPVQKIPVRYVQITDPTGQLVLMLGIRQVGDVFGIGERTTTPTGTLKTGLTLTIGGISVPTTQLVVDNKTTAWFYNPVKPFGYTYIQGHEIQAELDLINTPGVTTTITDLAAVSGTRIANTIIGSLTFADVYQSLPPPPASATPLGQYRIEAFRPADSNTPDTRLISHDGGIRRVVINSTRTAAGLVSGHGLMELAFPAYGHILYLQDVALANQTSKGPIWTYDTITKHLSRQGTYPALGWGAVAVNRVRTRAVYVSSTDAGDSGYITTLYYLDLVNNTLSTLLTLPDNQSFSSGWGGTTNAFSFGWKNDDVVRYTAYDQNTGNKQRNQVKTKIGAGEVVAPGANPATQ